MRLCFNGGFLVERQVKIPKSLPKAAHLGLKNDNGTATFLELEEWNIK